MKIDIKNLNIWKEFSVEDIAQTDRRVMYFPLDLRTKLADVPEAAQAADSLYRAQTENHAGFCIDIGWGGLTGQDSALEILDTAFDYIRNFDPEEHTYDSRGTENLIRSGLAGAKELMLKVREEIFEQKRVTFSNEYWDPFD